MESEECMNRSSRKQITEVSIFVIIIAIIIESDTREHGWDHECPSTYL